jgi:hypothetical protein
MQPDASALGLDSAVVQKSGNLTQRLAFGVQLPNPSDHFLLIRIFRQHSIGAEIPAKRRMPADAFGLS